MLQKVGSFTRVGLAGKNAGVWLAFLWSLVVVPASYGPAHAQDTDPPAARVDSLGADSLLIPPADSLMAPVEESDDRPSPPLLDTGAVPDSVVVDSQLVTVPTGRADSLETNPPADSLVTAGFELTVEPDSTVSDSLSLPDSSLARRYLPPHKKDRMIASLFPRRRSVLQPRIGNYWRHEIQLDSTRNVYLVRETVAGQDVRLPVTVDPEAYFEERLRYRMNTSFRDLIAQQARQRQRQRRGLGLNIVVPGGKQSAFTTIFGKPEVDLRVNGQVNIDAGFAYQKSDQRISFTGKEGQLDPDFGQNIRLGITGSIGDKLRIDVNWDTERTFDFQNQLKLEYTGYEDEIIQKIVAGNVFLQTPSSLIQGGQRLFGIRSDLQLGGVKLTTVVSQQEGQSEELEIEGGSQTTPFSLKPTDYDDNTHYFLSYYFRNQWEPAHADPPILRIQIDRITDIEVWKLQQTTIEQDNERQVVAFVDLGESQAFADDPYRTASELPGPALDRYTDADFAVLRDGTQAIEGYLTQLGVDAPVYQVGKFRKLERGRDFEIDEFLGTISLQTRLTENEAIGIAFRYVANGQVFQVGDFANESGGTRGQQNDDRLILKLLRKANQIPSDPSWPLTMRNIYKIPGRGFNRDDLELDVLYERPGQPASKTLPGVVTSGRQQTLLQLLGLDRLNEEDAQAPDNRFDFQPYLIRQSTGQLFFPFLEPFGDRIASITDNEALIFRNLYKQKQAEARRDSEHDVYRISGSTRSAVQEVYNLGFFGIVEGSVRVTSGGAPMSEGADYVVDYSTNTVTITNPAFLAAGRDINISYERNQFAAIQKKTLVGLRADYDFSDEITFGATLMRLAEKPLIDKFRIGDEPLSNVIWGVDGAADFEPRWLTRAIDALPLIQTKAPSAINLQGEFAQLLPGHPTTQAFDRTRKSLRNADRDLKSDEIGGISFIDDFEGVETGIPLTQAGAWRLSSVPDSTGAVGPFEFNGDSLRTTWRGELGWYVLPLNLGDFFNVGIAEENIDAVRPIHINEVFPNKDVSAESGSAEILSTFDMFFDPSSLGPYNFTNDLDRFNIPSERKRVWGGMTQRLPEGYTDFDVNNVEFIEFIVSVHSLSASQDAGPDARLLIDIGSISEDVIPNEKLNTEDGLTLNNIDRAPLDPLKWTRLSSGIQDAVVNVDVDTRKTEDVGLDGFPSHSGANPAYEITELDRFAEHVTAVRDAYGEGSPEYQRALNDPSGDDYHHFRDSYFSNSQFFSARDQSLLQKRFSRFFPGVETNSFEGQRDIIGNTPPLVGNSNVPDTEDINLNATLDTDDRYYQYEVPLSTQELDQLADPRSTDDVVITKIEGVNKNDNRLTSEWYQIRIPVRKFKRRVGGISDFNLIQSMRIWTTGHTDPVTLRFATLKLVGSQWQKSDKVNNSIDISSSIQISTINNEENPNYQIPSGAIQSQTRVATGGVQKAREQAMLIRVEDVQPGDERAIFKPFSRGVDLLKYSNLRMFVHGHGDGFDQRGDLTLFVRLGLNEDSDYYEYEQPITPSDPFSLNPDTVWQTNLLVGDQRIDLNSMNIELSAFNRLKVERDDSVAAGVQLPTDLFPVLHQGRAYDFAPPGTRLSVKGNPSLSGVSTIVIGIRSSEGNIKILQNAEIWLNELRATGYDEKAGWAAIGTAQIRLADLATINANVRTQTDGFGGLSSGLGTRETNDVTSWSLTTSTNLHKLIPERFGWNMPLSFSIRSSQTTPRYAPDRGDIRLEEILAQIDENENLSASERQEERNNVLDAAQTATTTTSISIPLSKRGSRSKVLRNTVDATTLNYSYSKSSASNPSSALNDSWRWSGSVNYRFAARTPRTIKPFWFLDDLPVIRALGNLRMSYIPQSVSTSAAANRGFTQSQERSRLNIIEGSASEDSLLFQNDLRYPFRETHSFEHTRSFGFQYNPFTFLNLSYDSNIDQSLRAVGADTLYSVATFDDSLGYRVIDDIRLEDAIRQGAVLDTLSAIEISRLEAVPLGDVLGRVFAGTRPVRTERYGQNFSATFQPRFTRTKALDWLTIQPVAYTSRFQWQNGPAGLQNTGAGVSNNASVRGGVRLAVQEFWRKFAFYRNMERIQKQKVDDKRIERSRRSQERRDRKEARRQQKEQEKLAREQARARAEAGEPEDVEMPAEGEAPPDLEVQEEPGVPRREQPRELGAAGTEPARRETEAPADSTEKRSRFRLPLPNLNPVNLARKTFLAVTSPRTLTINYTSSWGGNSGHVKGAYRVLESLGGNGPSLGYRLGFDRTIPPEVDLRFVDNPALQVTDRLQDSRQWSAKTDVSLSQSLRIDLNWDARWDGREDITYNLSFDGFLDETITQSGTNHSSIWAFGGSYVKFYESQRDAFLEDAAAAADQGNTVIDDANGDGRIVLANETLEEDFRGAYVGSLGSIGRSGFVPFPMPNWSVSYTNLGNWPILRRLAQSATLRHGYVATYDSDFRTNASAGFDEEGNPRTNTRNLRTSEGSRQIEYVIPDIELGSIRINERFQPLVGVDLTWKGAIQTGFNWNKSRATSLSTTNADVNENTTEELSFNLSYSKRGLRLPLPFLRRKKLNNTVRLSLSARRSKSIERRFRLQSDLEDFLQDNTDSETFLSPSLIASTRTSLEPRISYTFSTRISADFFVKYEHNDSQGSRVPTTTNIKSGFNIRVSISN